MSTNESTRAPVYPLDFASAFVANVLDSANPQPFTPSSSKSGKRWLHWFQPPEDDNPRPRKLFFEDSARRPEVVANLLVAAGQNSGAIADTILHDRISPRRLPPARVGSPRDFTSAPAAAPRVPGLTVAPCSDPELSARRLPPVLNLPAASCRPSIAPPGGYRPKVLVGYESLPRHQIYLSSPFQSIYWAFGTGWTVSVSPPFRKYRPSADFLGHRV